eukprot:11585564-Heterocapsa_arctica.AAC.1
MRRLPSRVPCALRPSLRGVSIAQPGDLQPSHRCVAISQLRHDPSVYLTYRFGRPSERLRVE